MSTTTATHHAVVSIEPAALSRAPAAAFLGVSESTLETLSRTVPLLRPTLVSPGRVVWQVQYLRTYLATCPTANLPPPRGSGYGRAGKPSQPAGSQAVQA